jgi:hypothetical protein
VWKYMVDPISSTFICQRKQTYWASHQHT